MKSALLVVAACAALALAGSAAADQSYTDSAGEVAGSADISAVSVSNDPTAGTITFGVTTNMPTLEPNSEFDILVNADGNTSTGATSAGLDFLFGLDTGGWFFTSWNGSQFADVPAVTDAQVAYVNGVLTFRMAAADIGTPSAFTFAVLTFRGPDPNNPLIDQAPDSGLYSYTMTTPPPPPPPPPPAPQPVTIDSVAVAVAGVPTHGRSFHVTALKVDLSNGAETKATGLKCSATVGGARLAGTGTGTCTFHLPATSKGKKLTLRVTGHYKAKTLVKTASFTVK